MAWTNNYNTIEPCDALTNWTAAGTAANFAVDTTKQLQGTGCLVLEGGIGVATWTHTLAVGDRFSLEDSDLFLSFYYVKGKGAAYLGTALSSCLIRCWINGTTAYVDFWQGGDADLNFGWNVLAASGNAYDAVSGTVDLANDVHQVALVLTFAVANSGDNDAAFYMDYLREGTLCTYTGVDTDLSSLKTYSDSNGLGIIDIEDIFVRLRCGIQIGSGGTAGSLTEAGKFLLFDSKERLITTTPPTGSILFSEVKHNLIGDNGGTIQFGTLEIGTDDNYPVDGCQLVVPSGNYSNITMKNGSSFKAYASKIYRWGIINLGEAITDTNTVDMNLVDIDSCELVQLYSQNISWVDVEVHDNAAVTYSYAGQILSEPDLFKNILVHDTGQGFRFMGSFSLEEYISRDNTTYDLVIQNLKTVSILNGIFDDTKIGYVA